MNVIFLTLSYIPNIEERGIYKDLMRKFRNEGHQVYIVSATERRMGVSTSVVETNGVKILHVKTLNVQKSNMMEKGLGTLLIEKQFKAAIKKYLHGVKFELILYSTPPITFTNIVRYLKRENPKAVAYLLLKDIFPQNAVDIGMFGNKSLFNWYFRIKEMALYKNSDFIGCMSPANVNYLKKHNPFYPEDHIEVAPNSIELVEKTMEEGQYKAERYYIRKKYNLPTNVPIFIYGGNLGKPQGIDYLIKCLDANKHRNDCYFVIIGNGTEYKKLNEWYLKNENSCVRLMERLPKQDYDLLVRYCDVGLIFLDHRFTIPNYPSRLLSYLEYKMPVICATDGNTDVGIIAEENGYGFWCESVRPEDFTELVDRILKSDCQAMGERGYQFLKENYLVDHTYKVLMNHFI
jgi:glycosyltransferase involved in cell wall biosynthesis